MLTDAALFILQIPSGMKQERGLPEDGGGEKKRQVVEVVGERRGRARNNTRRLAWLAPKIRSAYATSDICRPP